MTEAFDVAIVGGGLVGLGAAYALARGADRPRVVVLEAEASLASHQSGRNSGVLHAGLYYPPGSLKARLCTRGRAAMERFCEERGVAFARTGKVVVASDEGELPALAELERRGLANGVRLRRASLSELREREPHVAGVAGLVVEDTGVVDFRGVARALGELLETELGGEVRRGFRVTTVDRRSDGITVGGPAGELRTKNLVACAGLHADRVARLAGLTPGVAIVPFRGEYWELAPGRRELCRGAIYPVPDARFPFLGVHYTRRIDGAVECGPNAVLALAREGYHWRDVDPRAVLEMARWRGFRRLAARHLRFGLAEAYRSLHKAAFVRALQRLVPDVRSDDLAPGGSGVRAQAVDAEGNLVSDFAFARAPRMLHVMNAPSPAATASLAIGEHLAELARGTFVS